MAVKLSDTLVKELEAPATGNKIAYDEAVKGFGVRVTSAGARAFILNYRAGGRERRITIGSYPEWKVGPARKWAEGLKRKVDMGEDPMADRHEERAAPTVADLARIYREVHLPTKRPVSVKNDEMNIAKHILPRLGKMRVADVARADITKLHREMSSTTPTQANRVLALLSVMFNVAKVEKGWIAENPVKGVKRNQENRRNRYLKGPEIMRLGEALAAHPERSSANAIRLLLLTGARRGETLSATWLQIDLDEGVWTKPSAHTKQAKEHRVPLSAAARALLTEMKAAADPACPLLFPGVATKDAKGRTVWQPQREVRRCWIAVCAKAGLGEQVEQRDSAGKVVMDKHGKPVMAWETDVRLHDLRHSYASILASSGLSLPIIGALLGHTQAATTARYAHLLDDPLRAATERVGAIVTGAGKVGADVVPMRRGA